jgi:hypothetical protein
MHALRGPIIRRAHRNQAYIRLARDSRAKPPKTLDSPKLIKIKEMRIVTKLYPDGGSLDARGNRRRCNALKISSLGVVPGGGANPHDRKGRRILSFLRIP